MGIANKYTFHRYLRKVYQFLKSDHSIECYHLIQHLKFNLSTGTLIYKNSASKVVNGKKTSQKFHKEIKLAKGYKIPDLTTKKMDDGTCTDIKQQLGVKTQPSEAIRYELCY